MMMIHVYYSLQYMNACGIGMYESDNYIIYECTCGIEMFTHECCVSSLNICAPCMAFSTLDLDMVDTFGT